VKLDALDVSARSLLGARLLHASSGAETEPAFFHLALEMKN